MLHRSGRSVRDGGWPAAGGGKQGCSGARSSRPPPPPGSDASPSPFFSPSSPSTPPSPSPREGPPRCAPHRPRPRPSFAFSDVDSSSASSFSSSPSLSASPSAAAPPFPLSPSTSPSSASSACSSPSSRPLSPVQSLGSWQWGRSISSLVRSVQSRLPFLSTRRPRMASAEPQSPPPPPRLTFSASALSTLTTSTSTTSSSSSSSSSSHSVAVRVRKRSFAALRQSTLDGFVRLDAQVEVEVELEVDSTSAHLRASHPHEVVIDVDGRNHTGGGTRKRRLARVHRSGARERRREVEPALPGGVEQMRMAVKKRRVDSRRRSSADEGGGVEGGGEKEGEGGQHSPVPLLSVVVEPALALGAVALPFLCPPLLVFPTSFPPLQALSSLLASSSDCSSSSSPAMSCDSLPAPASSAVGRVLPSEVDVERAVWSCLWSVERCIDAEVRALLSSLPGAWWSGSVESFRSLQLKVLDISPQDVRLRRLCMMEPQYAVYVLHTLRRINGGGGGGAAGGGRLAASAAAEASDAAPYPVSADLASPRLTFRVHRRSRTECELLRGSGEKKRRLHTATPGLRSSPSTQPAQPRAHRRTASLSYTRSREEANQAPTSSSSVYSSPLTFAAFLSTSKGFSYPVGLPQCPTFDFSAASVVPSAAPSAYLHPFLRCASGVHLLLLSVLYLSLLHTTDAASVKKAHFASALIHRTPFELDRPHLPLLQQQRAAAEVRRSRGGDAASKSEAMDAMASAGVPGEGVGCSARPRRVRAMEGLYSREIFFLIDSLCLTLLQHDALPPLPYTTFRQGTLPDLPISHTLGLR